MINIIFILKKIKLKINIINSNIMKTKKIIWLLFFLFYFIFPNNLLSQIPQEFKERRERLMENFSSESIIMFKGSSETSGNGDVNDNFYYLTGLENPDCILFLSPGRKIYIREKREYVKELILVPPQNIQREIWNGARLGPEGVMEELGFESSLPNTEYENYFRNLLFQADTLFFEYSPLSLDKPLTRELEIIKKAKERLYKFETASINNNKIIQLREIKSSSEIELIKKAIEITRQAHKNIMKEARPGMYEYELEAILEYTFKKNGARRNGFPPIIGSGPFSCILHYNKNDRKTNSGELVVIDIGAEYKMYSADITRTIPISGKFSQRQKEIYNIVLKAHDEAISLIKPGIRKNEIHNKAVDIISDGLVNLGLIKDKKEYRKYYMHGTSHPIGLDVHDPSVSRILKPGMIITIEPGIYIREENLGIRIEDDVLVTETGYEILSKGTPVTIEEIENLMDR